MSSYKEYRAKLKEKQEKMSYEEIKQEMTENNDFIVELDNLKPQKHIWVDRGEVMSCEGAHHPNHRSFKR